MLHRRIRAAFRGWEVASARRRRLRAVASARRRASRVVASPKDSTRGTRTRARTRHVARRDSTTRRRRRARDSTALARDARARVDRVARRRRRRARVSRRDSSRGKVARAATTHTLGAAMRGWRRAAYASRRTMYLARRAFDALRAEAPLREAFFKWLRETKTTKDSRALGARRASHVQRMWRRVLNRACHLAFRGWTRRVEERRRLRVAAKRVARARARARRRGRWMDGSTSSASVKNRARRFAARRP